MITITLQAPPVYTYIYKSAHALFSVSIFKSTHANVQKHIFSCTFIHKCIQLHIYMCVYIYIYIYIYNVCAFVCGVFGYCRCTDVYLFMLDKWYRCFLQMHTLHFFCFSPFTSCESKRSRPHHTYNCCCCLGEYWWYLSVCLSWSSSYSSKFDLAYRFAVRTLPPTHLPHIYIHSKWTFQSFNDFILSLSLSLSLSLISTSLFRFIIFIMSLSLSLSLYIYIYLPTPPLGQDMTQGQFLSGV